MFVIPQIQHESNATVSVCGSDMHTLCSGWGALQTPMIAGYAMLAPFIGYFSELYCITGTRLLGRLLASGQKSKASGSATVSVSAHKSLLATLASTASQTTRTTVRRVSIPT